VTAGIGGPAATDATAVTAEAIAAAVRGCPAVADLHAGGLVRIATYLPGRRIDGVQLADDRVLISVVAAYGVPLVLLTDQIRAAVRPLAGGRRVDIHVADLQLPGEEQVALPPGSGTSPALGA
jgi:hypothetical protein